MAWRGPVARESSRGLQPGIAARGLDAIFDDLRAAARTSATRLLVLCVFITLMAPVYEWFVATDWREIGGIRIRWIAAAAGLLGVVEAFRRRSQATNMFPRHITAEGLELASGRFVAWSEILEIYTSSASASAEFITTAEEWRIRLVPSHGSPVDIHVRMVGRMSEKTRSHFQSLIFYIGAMVYPHLVAHLQGEAIQTGGAQFGKRIRVLPDGLEVFRLFRRKLLIKWDAVIGPVFDAQLLVEASVPRLTVKYRNSRSSEKVLSLGYVNRIPNLQVLCDQLENRVLTFHLNQ